MNKEEFLVDADEYIHKKLGIVNKQEEIREGLLAKVKSIRAWCGNPDDPLSAEDDVDDILRWLHSKGVVRKVDRELPAIPNKAQFPYSREKSDIALETQWDILKAGYVAVEDLI